MIKFYGYKHWTLEEPSRCFNVGKGILGRAYSKRSRNHKWHAIVKRYGLRVEICVGPLTNSDACNWEIENIKLMNTFTKNHSHDDFSDIACNFTKGGDGSRSCYPSQQTRQKISKSHMGNKAGEVLKNRPKSEAHKQAIRLALKGNINVSKALLGNKHTLGRVVPPEEIAKRSASIKLRHARRKLLKLLQERCSHE